MTPEPKEKFADCLIVIVLAVLCAFLLGTWYGEMRSADFFAAQCRQAAHPTATRVSHSTKCTNFRLDKDGRKECMNWRRV